MLKLWRQINKVFRDKPGDIQKTEQSMIVLEKRLGRIVGVMFFILAFVGGYLSASLSANGVDDRGLIIALTLLVTTIGFPLFIALSRRRSNIDFIERRARRTRLYTVAAFMFGMLLFAFVVLNIARLYMPNDLAWYQSFAPSLGLEIIGVVLTLVFMDVLLRTWSEAEESHVKALLIKHAQKNAKQLVSSADLQEKLRQLAHTWIEGEAIEQGDLPPSYYAGRQVSAAQLIALLDAE